MQNSRKTLDLMSNYRKRSWLDTITYNWMNKNIDAASCKGNLALDDLGRVTIEESTEYHTKLLRDAWDHQTTGDRYQLLKAILSVYKWILLKSIIALWI